MNKCADRMIEYMTYITLEMQTNISFRLWISLKLCTQDGHQNHILHTDKSNSPILCMPILAHHNHGRHIQKMDGAFVLALTGEGALQKPLPLAEKTSPLCDVCAGPIEYSTASVKNSNLSSPAGL